MKRILLTGASGFIGRNILPVLKEKYGITSPSREQLDLLDGNSVYSYLKKEKFDIVFHLANPTGHNLADAQDRLFENSMCVFTALLHCSAFFGKMIYIGSGAEYGKHRSLAQIKEDDFGTELPKDSYGLSRFIMNELTKGCSNIINLRLFGCYGPGDPSHKLVPSVIKQVKSGNTVTLNQDCWFDFLYVTDIADVLSYFAENENKYSNYNVCSGERVRITTIAEEICKQMGVNTLIQCKKDGFNLEYTGSNDRIKNEIPGWQPLKMKESISNILIKEGLK